MHLEGHGVSEGPQAPRITGSQHMGLCSYYKRELEMCAIILLVSNPLVHLKKDKDQWEEKTNNSARLVVHVKIMKYVLFTC